MLEIQDLVKHYGAIKAVSGVSFKLEAGQCYGLLGPNGAGKSTTLNMISGLTTADSGKVSLTQSDKPLQQALGLVPQSLALYEALTARENLRFFGKLYAVNPAELKQRISDCLALVGLSDRADEPVENFSGGMKRRLNLAIALMHQPEILLLDEPTVGVDPQSRNLLFDNIERLKQSGMTILYTTHYMEEAERLCDQIAIMDHGEILAEGSLQALIEQYGGNSTIRIQSPGESELSLEAEEIATALPSLLQSGLQLQHMHINRPNLETVFLNLTGRQLRDHAA